MRVSLRRVSVFSVAIVVGAALVACGGSSKKSSNGTTTTANGKNRRLYMGRRLANGNTVMSLSAPGELVEVNPSGQIVRSIGGTNPAIQMGWTSGFTFMPNGNMLINDYTGRRIIEVDTKGKVVNEWRTGSRTIASIDLVH